MIRLQIVEDRNGYVGQKELAPHTVALWIIEFQSIVKKKSHLTSLLSPEERKRSESFYFESDAHRYICAHGALRMILGLYTNRHPGMIDLTYEPNGKPRLVQSDSLEFNLSRTKDLIAIAVTPCREVGVDIERCVRFPNMGDVARKVMNHEEYIKYISLTPDDRIDFFFRCWVRKEAFVKALGTGLHNDLHGFSVMEQYSELGGNVLLFHDGKIWCMADFVTGKYEHFGSICLEGDQLEVIAAGNNMIDALFN